MSGVYFNESTGIFKLSVVELLLPNILSVT